MTAIAIGGAVGALSRYGMALAIGRGTFPWSTLVVNVSGSLLFGFLAIWLASRLPMATDLRAFVLVGLLGSFTTFSTFSWETMVLLENGAFVKAGLNMFANVTVCLLAVIAGVALARQLT